MQISFGAHVSCVIGTVGSMFVVHALAPHTRTHVNKLTLTLALTLPLPSHDHKRTKQNKSYPKTHQRRNAHCYCPSCPFCLLRKEVVLEDQRRCAYHYRVAVAHCDAFAHCCAWGHSLMLFRLILTTTSFASHTRTQHTPRLKKSIRSIELIESN